MVVAVEEEGDKAVSLMVGVGLIAPRLNLCKIVVVVVVVDDDDDDDDVVDGDVGVGYEIGEDEIGGLLGFLLLPLLRVLNLEPDFDDDDDDDEVVADDDDNSCEDPESDPCWWCDFPLPAFNEALHLFLVGC
ncbi:hypothetical protein E2542_SST09322 [Spatholobus suberectus]|nr:hypothetical protein E2542_SST09322 [Spatholobus suberectus]